MGILQLEMKQESKQKLLPKKPKQAESDSNPATIPDVLFSDYRLDSSWEEALWMATVPEQSTLNTPEPMIEEENSINSVWDINVEVNDESTPPSEAYIIAENNNESESYPFPKEASEDLDENWGHSSYHAPAALVEGINVESNNNNVIEKDASEIDAIYNLDLVQFAIGESDLDGFLNEDCAQDSCMDTVDEKAITAGSVQSHLALQLVASTATFIHHTDELFTINPTSISLNPLKPHPEIVVANKSKPPMNKKVGRPERQTPLEITEVPRKGSVSVTPSQMRSLKYRRMRDLNNEASKKCRKNRKEKQNVKETECQEEEEKNLILRERMHEKESQVEAWRLKCKAVGWNILEIKQ